MAEAGRLRDQVGLGREDRYLEFKESRPWDDLKPKLCRTAMAMANIRDGGTIVVGVGQRSGSLVARGVPPADLATYDEDDVLAFANRYAEPYVRLEVHKFEYEKASLVGIVVREFDEVPVVCRRSYENVLRQGAIYTRSYRMAETCQVQTQTEMREIMRWRRTRGYGTSSRGAVGRACGSTRSRRGRIPSGSASSWAGSRWDGESDGAGPSLRKESSRTRIGGSSYALRSLRRSGSRA